MDARNDRSIPPERPPRCAYYYPTRLLCGATILLSLATLFPAVCRSPDVADLPPRERLIWDVVGALHGANVTFWLHAGAALVLEPDAERGAVPGTDALRLSVYHESVDFGALGEHRARLASALPSLHTSGVQVEDSSFGLRMCRHDGHADRRLSFRTPHVDIILYWHRDGVLRSPCCDCMNEKASVCTKSMCSCRRCEHPLDHILPTRSVRLQGVGRVPAPHHANLVVFDVALEDTFHAPS